MAEDMTEDKGAREIQILPHVEQRQGGFNRNTQSFWVEVPTKADGTVRLSFTEGVLDTLLNMFGSLEQHAAPHDPTMPVAGEMYPVRIDLADGVEVTSEHIAQTSHATIVFRAENVIRRIGLTQALAQELAEKLSAIEWRGGRQPQ
jgi:hypothetical protein